MLYLASLLLASLTTATGMAAPSYSVIAQLPAGDGGWDLASVAPIDQRLYVAHGDRVTAIDLKTGQATDRLMYGQRVHAALAIPGSHDVISTNGGTNNAVLFDGRTGQIRATIATGKNPDAAAYDPATQTVWIMNPGSGDATVVDAKSGAVLATVAIGGSLELAVADGQGRMYVNVEDKNEVVVLDTRRHRVIRHFALQAATARPASPTIRQPKRSCRPVATAWRSSPHPSGADWQACRSARAQMAPFSTPIVTWR